MPITAVAPQRLYQQIANQIRHSVAAGEFAANGRLPAERDLARQLGVSRPSLREALIALEVEGVIEVRTGSGIYVCTTGERNTRHGGTAPSSEWSPMQLMQARELVEGEVCALAARHASKTDIQAMADALQAMRVEAASGGDPRQSDKAFHNAIAHACGNEVLRDTVRQYEEARDAPIFARLGGYFETPTSWRSAIREHEAVLQALRERNPVAACLAMQKHLRRTRTRYTASWQRAQDRNT